MKGLKDLTTGKFVKNIPLSKNCLQCKIDFSPRLNSQKFCSKKCDGKNKTKIKERQCATCKREFVSNTRKTRYCSQECFTKSGKRTRKGSENNRWKGGVTPVNSRIRSSAVYKTWVREILQRDDFTCQFCKKRGNRLHVDHIIPFAAVIEKLKFEQGIENLFDKAMNYGLLWNTGNGRTLCIECHKKTESYLNYNCKYDNSNA